MSELGITADKTKESVALLIGVYRAKELKTCEEHLEELADLADTFGIQVGGRISCPIRKIDAATYLGEGKLREIKERIDEFGVSIVIFDEEISPAQQRNLEKLLKVAVMDRTELILEIFAGRAQTKEAKLQIELAQTKYEFPRLKRLWSHFSRQRASGGYLKGEGEKQIEIDRRLLSLKIEKLQSELKQVEKSREIQKQARQRSEIPTFALIGYTNAGKSTLLNALPQANV
ncbi:MAG: GTPase HflX, partial [Chlamydiia bacterium]|nr:GTPase HflX [Chlamydiia bacterium]